MPIRYQHTFYHNSFNKLHYVAKQRGSALVLALFVIIILTLLGSILMNITSTSSETVSQEVLGTRAYMAANSAMQAELNKVFPLNEQEDDDYCEYLIETTTYHLEDSSEDIPGLYDCSAKTTCNLYYTDTNSVNYYRLTSTGECGSGVMQADSLNMVNSSRTIQVEARSL